MAERDCNSQARGDPRFWFDNTSEFAAKVWNLSNLSLNPRARTARFFHDRHWHGRSQAKGARTNEVREEPAIFPV